MVNAEPLPLKRTQMAGQVCGIEKDKPPGAIKSAPLARTGMTADGVERNGSRSACFHNVYTEMEVRKE
jgi:hypothetical protein